LQESVWPLELVWLRDGSKTGFDIAGPNKTLSVMGDNSETKSQWFNALKTHIESRLLHQPKFNEIKDLTDLSINLQERFSRFEFSSKEVYTGNWLSGNMHGPGVLDYFGTTWEGMFIEGKKTNEGKLKYNDGTVYVGEFENSIPHGNGETLSPLGDSYVGEWSNGRRHGTGDLVFANGDSYVGEFVNGILEGKGVMKSQSVSYEGSFKDGVFSGSGILELPIGVYEGDFECGLRSGRGTLKYTDGSSYEGQWKEDRYHGKGTYYFLQGAYVGDFVKGSLEGEGTTTYANGSSYEGTWKDGRYHGHGLFRYPGAFELQFEGEWDYGRKHKGILTFSDGSKWDGNFVNGKISGNGKYTYPNGLMVEAKWKNGARDGKVGVTLADIKIQADKGKEETFNAEYLPPESLPSFDMVWSNVLR